jgi:hypothetical protein
LNTQGAFSIPVAPMIPLTVEVRQAYQDLNDRMETAIENTADVAVLEPLNTWQGEVDGILTKDAMYQLHADSALFDALQKQICDTNKGLKTLQAQIEAIASHFAEAGEVLAAINKVLTLIPGI